MSTNKKKIAINIASPKKKGKKIQIRGKKKGGNKTDIFQHLRKNDIFQ